MHEVMKLLTKSLLEPLLTREDITDISYNGEALYYFSNTEGRKLYKKAEPKEMMALLRNIANFTNKRFSYLDVFMDVSFGKYRLSAMHHAIGRHHFQEVVTFALRINNEYLQKTKQYVDNEVKDIIIQLLLAKKSIVICGATGVGKTTLQKYILSLLSANTRIIVIDNVLELDEVKTLNKKLDLTLWQLNDQDEDEVVNYIKRALRFHPDYLIIAESRGREMKEIYQGAITGHPNIITLHAENITFAYKRMAFLSGEQSVEALYEAFPFIIFLEKGEQNALPQRYVASISSYDYKKRKLLTLYKRGESND